MHPCRFRLHFHWTMEAPIKYQLDFGWETMPHYLGRGQNILNAIMDLDWQIAANTPELAAKVHFHLSTPARCLLVCKTVCFSMNLMFNHSSQKSLTRASRDLKSKSTSYIGLFCVFVFRTACTVPLIDYIDGNKFTTEPQQGGDEDGLARGAWDWSLLWKRVPLSQREKAQRKHTTLPYRYTFWWQHANFHPCSVCVSISVL